MATQLELVRAKVQDKARESLEKLTKERKRKKKRELSLSTDKQQTAEKEAKKVRLVHHDSHRIQHETTQQRQTLPLMIPHRPPQKTLSPDSTCGKPITHHHHHNGYKKEQTSQHPVPHPCKAERKPSLPPVLPTVPPVLFSFTSLKVVRAKPLDGREKEKHRIKEHKVKPKKENTEGNVKHGSVKKKKGPRTRTDSLRTWTNTC